MDQTKEDAIMMGDMVPPPSATKPSTDQATPPRLLVALPLVTVAWLVLSAVLVMAMVRIARWELAPGEALTVSPRLEFVKTDGTAPVRFENKKGIHFVTAFGGQVSVLDALMGWLDPHVQIDSAKERFGTISPTDSRKLGYQSMVGAKQVAEYVAMNKLGLKAELVLGDIVVEQLVCEGKPAQRAACDVLDVGETITAFNGIPTPTLEDLSVQMTGASVGDTVELNIIPYVPGAGQKDLSTAEKRTVTLMADPDQPTRAIIGFVPADTRTVKLPFEANISTEGIGGPSAGLAFTIALLDELTEGNLVGRGKVAATGTIAEDAKVGAIGALEQKAVAVRDAGVTLFLVPESQSDEEVARAARAAGRGLKIVKVGTLDDALAALRANGGDPLPGS